MNNTVVVEADWLVPMVMLDICELVTFPLMARSTFKPLLVLAITVEAFRGGVGVVRWVGVEVAGFGVWVGISDG